MSKMKISARTLALSGVIMLSLSACSGHDQNQVVATPSEPALPPPPPPPPPAIVVPGLHHAFILGSVFSETWRFGVIGDSGNGPAEILKATRNTDVTNLLQATIFNRVATKVHVNSMLVWNDQRLVRQVLVGQSGALQKLSTSSQVSTLTVSQTCNGGRTFQTDGDGGYVQRGLDYNDAGRSWSVFRKAGADARCYNDDDVFVAVRMDMTASEAPLAIGRPVFAIHAPNGALSGWLMHKGLEMQRVNADFSNPVTLFTLPIAMDGFVPPSLNVFDIQGYSDSNLGNVFTFIADRKMYAADLDSPGAVTPTPINAPVSNKEYFLETLYPDPDTILFSIASFAGEGSTRFVRYTISTKTSTLIGTMPFLAEKITLTATRIIGFNSGKVAALALAGGQSQSLPLAYHYRDQPYKPSEIWHGGERIWRDSETGVVSINSDGSGALRLDDSHLAGCVSKPVINVVASTMCEAVIVVKGGLVQAYDATTGELRLTYGSVPLVTSGTNWFRLGPAFTWGSGAVLTSFTEDAPISLNGSRSYFIQTDKVGVTPILLP